MGIISDLAEAAGDIIGEITGTNAAEEAAQQGREGLIEATRLGVEESRRQFGIARQALNPFMMAGRNALARLGDPEAMVQAAQKHPAFQFQMGQGIKAIGRSGAARGFRNSGNIMHSLQEFGQGLASDFFNKEFSRQFDLARLGQSSAGALAGASIQTGGQLSQLFSRQGLGLASIGSNLGAQQIAGRGNLLDLFNINVGVG